MPPYSLRLLKLVRFSQYQDYAIHSASYALHIEDKSIQARTSRLPKNQEKAISFTAQAAD